MKFKSLRSPSKLENNIAIVLLYYMYQIDNSIRLRTDKRQLEDKSWNYARDYFSNSGKIIQNMKKILPFLEDKKISESHFFEIKRHMETLNPSQIELLHNQNGVTGLVYNYAMACFNLTKFLRSVYKIDEEPKITVAPYNPPRRKENRVLNAEEAAKMTSTIGKNLCVNHIVTSKQNNFKVKLHSDMYNENLANGFESLKKENDIKNTEKRIQELKRLKSQMQWKDKRKTKEKIGNSCN